MNLPLWALVSQTGLHQNMLALSAEPRIKVRFSLVTTCEKELKLRGKTDPPTHTPPLPTVL